MPGLGRLIEFDERSRQFPIRELLAVEKPRRSYTWNVPITLDQGNQPACVGFSWAHELAARPVLVQGVTNAWAQNLYLRAQQLDQWPGENYDGSSVLGGVKAAKEYGYFGEYRWAFGENDLALAVGYKGPAVIGTNWYGGMMHPDTRGFIRPTGMNHGGHAYLVKGYNVALNAYKIHNSWGNWGIDGKGLAYIHRDDMVRLLAEYGEACIPVQRYMV